MSDTAASLTQWAIGVVLGSIGGSLGTLVALRTRLAKTDRDVDDGVKALARHIDSEQVAFDRLEAKLVARIAWLDKRQLAMLRITVDIGRKVGVDNREFDDSLLRMLTEDSA